MKQFFTLKEAYYAMDRLFYTFLISIIAVTISFAQPTGSPVAINGALKVSGNKIVNKNNQTASFAGPSFFWSNKGWGGERFYNSQAVDYFNQNWKSGIVRAAMGVEDAGGYLSDPANKTKVKTIVDAAIKNGQYVIIDWHSHHAEDYRQQSIDFFTDMAKTYGSYPNVIYEIYNEPLQVSWSSTIKPYAEAVIKAIRAVDPDNIIVVGTPTWSQDVDAAANDPITGYSNIAYTLHFYAATHKQSLRDKATYALSKGIALFVTEWGTCEASGNGFVDETSTNQWVNFMKTNGISNLNWSVNDKAESASILKSGVSSTGGWADSDLTTSGKLVKNIVLNWGGNTATDPEPPTSSRSPYAGTPYAIPGKIEAENFDKGGQGIAYNDSDATNSGGQYRTSEGVDIQTSAEGGYNIGWTNTGEWVEYTVNVSSAGDYKIDVRVASANTGGKFRIEFNKVNKTGTLTAPGTGGWQTWATVSKTVNLAAGQQVMRLYFESGGFNVNSFDINSVAAAVTYSITASAGTGGTITPSGSVSVNKGANQTFSISPSSGYEVSAVNVNGTNIGAVTSYTFTNVQANQTISASFKQQAVGATNLLANPGFENGTSPWTGNSSSIAADGSQKQSGSYSVKATNRSAAWAGPVQNIKAALINNGTGSYNISAFFKKESGSGNARVSVMLRYGGVSYYHGISGTMNSTSWTEVKGSLNLSWTGTLEDATLYLETPGNTANFFGDNCSLTKSTALSTANLKTKESFFDDKNEILIQTYPNPVQNVLKVDLPFGWGKGSEIKIINLNGQVVVSEIMQFDEHVIDFSNKPKGIYLIRINSLENIAKKIVKY